MKLIHKTLLLWLSVLLSFYGLYAFSVQWKKWDDQEYAAFQLREEQEQQAQRRVQEQEQHAIEAHAESIRAFVDTVTEHRESVGVDSPKARYLKRTACSLVEQVLGSPDQPSEPMKKDDSVETALVYRISRTRRAVFTCLNSTVDKVAMIGEPDGDEEITSITWHLRQRRLDWSR